MSIDITVDINDNEIQNKLDDLADAVAELRGLLSQVLINQAAEAVTDTIRYEMVGDTMADIDLQISAAQAAIAGQTTVIESARSTFEALRADLATVRDQLLAAGVTPEQLAALDALDDSVAANTESLATAITAGTVAEDEPAPADPNA